MVRPPRGGAHRLGIGIFFIAHGVFFSSWVSRIPSVKDSLALSEPALGGVLLAMGLGTFTALPAVGWFIGRWGAKAVMVGSALAAAATLLAAGASPSVPILVGALWLFGMAMGGLDVAMNDRAAELERAAGRSMMGSFHALWSTGAVLGPLLAAGLTARGWSPAEHFAVCALVVSLACLWGARIQIPQGPLVPAGARLAWPSRAVVAVGCVAGAAAVVEGGVAEWSGVYLRESLGAAPGLAPLGFGAFSLAMLIGRLASDRLIDRWGGRRVVVWGGLSAGIAVLAAVSVPEPGAAVALFGLAGLGMAPAFPIAFSQAGRSGPSPSSATAIAAVATMAYGSGLVGPPLIGFVAGASSLPLALLLLALAALLVALLGRRAIH